MAGKGKKQKKAKPKGYKGIWKTYEVKGDKLERKNKTCPKCGEGYKMAEHKDRLYCGKCGYTEFKKTKKE
ncbi:30S ribosomal protein S27ae [Candidatus Woesearchaeota archaeon]|nr:MAG: 30S ribosomal protein S27ae [Candidatus Woesearchaeota archaeon]